jgi:proline iminopeptidase
MNGGEEAGTPLYPAIEPFASGVLGRDRHRLFWETCGNDKGVPALVLHGGPGSGCSPWWRRLFDPSVTRVVLFDQRGCGRSRPHASERGVDLADNTTAHLVEDIEALRRHLGVDRWLVVGASWGTTLALAYAEAHPGAVRAMVLFSVVTTTAAEVRWITHHMGRFFPAEWEAFSAGASALPDHPLVDAYAELLAHPDHEIVARAARDWCRWDDTHTRLDRRQPKDPRFDDERFRLCFARLVTHYWRHAGFLDDGSLMEGAGNLAGIPGVLLHGDRDVSSPLDVPFELARRWPGADLRVVEGAGHGRSPRLEEAVVETIGRFAALP